MCVLGEVYLIRIGTLSGPIRVLDSQTLCRYIYTPKTKFASWAVRQAVRIHEGVREALATRLINICS